MNAQQKTDKTGKVTSRGIEWTDYFRNGTGYTSNPIKGCVHDCEWRMADGVIVKCYAGTFRDRIDGPGAFKNITYHPDELQKIVRHKQPAGIFIGSMADTLGNGVDPFFIQKTINTMASCPQHVFFVLTKNPRRLTEFEWPDNALVGISAPPTKMYGKEFTYDQQRVWFMRGMKWLAESKSKNKWVSLEPLSTSAILPALTTYASVLKWAVMGAASDGRKYHAPSEILLVKTFHILENIPCFMKGNLICSPYAKEHWKEEWPDMACRAGV